MILNWKDKNAWEIIPTPQGEQLYLFLLEQATPEELTDFLQEMSAEKIEGIQQNAAGTYQRIRKGNLVFCVSGESVHRLIDVWLPKYKTFCDFIRLNQKWDEVLMFFNRQPRSAFMIKMDDVPAQEIEQAKQFLQGFQVETQQGIAQFDSENIRKGDKVLMVTHPVSVNNLRRVWALEKEKNTLPKPFKRRPLDRKKGKQHGKRKFVPRKKIQTVKIDYSEHDSQIKTNESA